jgi:lipopolysaccharide export system protein LptA
MIPKNSLKIISMGLLLASSLLSTNAWAEKRDRDQPIGVVADEGSLDQTKQETIFTGNVEVTQGTLKMTAQRVQVNRFENGTQKMKATGSPVHFQQKLEGKNEWVRGRGNTVTYDSASGQVILATNARVERDGDVVTGDTITYNTHTEVYTAKRGASKGRVSVVLQPSTTGKK